MERLLLIAIISLFSTKCLGQEPQEFPFNISLNYNPEIDFPKLDVDIPDGEYVMYYPNNTENNTLLLAHFYYKNNKPHGLATWYNKLGDTVKHGSFKDGKRDGEWFFIEQQWLYEYSEADKLNSVPYNLRTPIDSNLITAREYHWLYHDFLIHDFELSYKDDFAIQYHRVSDTIAQCIVKRHYREPYYYNRNNIGYSTIESFEIHPIKYKSTALYTSQNYYISHNPPVKGKLVHADILHPDGDRKITQTSSGKYNYTFVDDSIYVEFDFKLDSIPITIANAANENASSPYSTVYLTPYSYVIKKGYDDVLDSVIIIENNINFANRRNERALIPSPFDYLPSRFNWSSHFPQSNVQIYDLEDSSLVYSMTTNEVHWYIDTGYIKEVYYDSLLIEQNTFPGRFGFLCSNNIIPKRLIKYDIRPNAITIENDTIPFYKEYNGYFIPAITDAKTSKKGDTTFIIVEDSSTQFNSKKLAIVNEKFFSFEGTPKYDRYVSYQYHNLDTSFRETWSLDSLDQITHIRGSYDYLNARKSGSTGALLLRYNFTKEPITKEITGSYKSVLYDNRKHVTTSLRNGVLRTNSIEFSDDSINFLTKIQNGDITLQQHITLHYSEVISFDSLYKGKTYPDENEIFNLLVFTKNRTYFSKHNVKPFITKDETPYSGPINLNSLYNYFSETYKLSPSEVFYNYEKGFTHSIQNGITFKELNFAFIDSTHAQIKYGLLHGKCIFFGNNQKRMEYHFKNGVLEGPMTQYHHKLSNVLIKKDSVYNSITYSNTYDSTKLIPIVTGSFHNNKPSGKWVLYSINGVDRVVEKNLKNGLGIGLMKIHREYHDSNEVKVQKDLEIELKNGNIHGSVKRYMSKEICWYSQGEIDSCFDNSEASYYIKGETNTNFKDKSINYITYIDSNKVIRYTIYPYQNPMDTVGKNQLNKLRNGQYTDYYSRSIFDPQGKVLKQEYCSLLFDSTYYRYWLEGRKQDQVYLKGAVDRRYNSLLESFKWNRDTSIFIQKFPVHTFEEVYRENGNLLYKLHYDFQKFNRTESEYDDHQVAYSSSFPEKRADFLRNRGRGWVTFYDENGLVKDSSRFISITYGYDCAAESYNEYFEFYYTDLIQNGDTVVKNGEGYIKLRNNRGGLYAQGAIKGGVRHGEWIFYNYDGNIVGKGSYDKGLKVGTWYEGDIEGLFSPESNCYNPDYAAQKSKENIHLYLSITTYNVGQVVSQDYIGYTKNE